MFPGVRSHAHLVIGVGEGSGLLQPIGRACARSARVLSSEKLNPPLSGERWDRSGPKERFAVRVSA